MMASCNHNIYQQFLWKKIFSKEMKPILSFNHMNYVLAYLKHIYVLFPLYVYY